MPDEEGDLGGGGIAIESVVYENANECDKE